MVEIAELKTMCEGKWFGIYRSLGIEVKENGDHGPCPVCGGTDRFRVDKDGSGYFCNQCDRKAGDGLGLVQRALRIPMAEAIEKVKGLIGVVGKEEIKITEKDPKPGLRDLWKRSVEIIGNDTVSKYLHSRGLMIRPEDIRICPRCWSKETGKNYTAMLAIFRNKDGKPISIHRTYLDGPKKADLKKPKKMMPPVEPISGGAVRLFPVTDILGIAEGVETAIACTQLFDVPTWAALSSTLMEAFVPPVDVKKIVVYSDNDRSFTGQKAAYVFANRNYQRYEIEVKIPDIVGDWNDVLMAMLQKSNEGGR